MQVTETLFGSTTRSSRTTADREDGLASRRGGAARCSDRSVATASSSAQVSTALHASVVNGRRWLASRPELRELVVQSEGASLVNPFGAGTGRARRVPQREERLCPNASELGGAAPGPRDERRRGTSPGSGSPRHGSASASDPPRPANAEARSTRRWGSIAGDVSSSRRVERRRVPPTSPRIVAARPSWLSRTSHRRCSPTARSVSRASLEYRRRLVVPPLGDQELAEVGVGDRCWHDVAGPERRLRRCLYRLCASSQSPANNVERAEVAGDRRLLGQGRPARGGCSALPAGDASAVGRPQHHADGGEHVAAERANDVLVARPTRACFPARLRLPSAAGTGPAGSSTVGAIDADLGSSRSVARRPCALLQQLLGSGQVAEAPPE